MREGRFDEKVRVASNDEIGYTGDVINEMSEGLRERDFIKDTFGKYVTQEIRDEILAGKISLDGELKEVTVLFADLRNFTPMVEKTPPQGRAARIINSYFKEMDEAIKQYHGLVLHYIGDDRSLPCSGRLCSGKTTRPWPFRQPERCSIDASYREPDP